MNDRERKLLVVVGILVFAILNLAAFKLVYSPRVKAANEKKKAYEEDLVLAMLREAMLDDKQGEIDCLNRNEQ